MNYYPHLEMKTDLEMNGGMEMNEAFGNEQSFRNERMEMKTVRGNELEMNQGLEMKTDLEMNKQTGGINMNQEFTMQELISKVQQIDDQEIREKILEILNEGGDTMDIDIIKQKVQNGYTRYIFSIKVVTYEDAEIVLHTIRKDLKNYKNTAKFFVRDNMIEVILNTNATLCVYYFTDPTVLDEVLKELPKLGVYCQVLNR